MLLDKKPVWASKDGKALKANRSRAGQTLVGHRKIKKNLRGTATLRSPSKHKSFNKRLSQPVVEAIY